MTHEKIQIEICDQGQRLDIFLARKLAARFSRSQIKKNIESGLITVAGKKIPAHYKVKVGEQVEFEWMEKTSDGTRAEDIPVDVIFEDDQIAVVNKTAGMVVHPAHGNLDHTLVNALLFHFKALSSKGGLVRPGIVHRLDKDTSGIMVIAKNDRAHEYLSRQFKSHTIEKVYYAIVKGVLQHNESRCEEPVGRAFLNRKKVVVKPSGGKDAETYFRVKQRFKNATWVEVFPKTGRTHQIRVHLCHLDHPIIGDSFYGMPSPLIARQALHAYSLAFNHPTTHERVHFECPLPEDMNQLLAHLAQE